MFLPLVPLVSVAALTYLFAVLDRWITAGRFQKPYYAVHVLHNAAIVAATARDVARSFTVGPKDLVTIPTTWSAVYLCYALHLYHCLLYWRSFHMDDWLHHGLMIGVALPLGSTVPTGPLMGMNLFFTTGLPGGVSYALLFAEKNGWISQVASRRWNARMNLWIRSPGCCAMAALVLAVMLSSPSPTQWEKAVSLAVAALTLWNGQYFMSQVVAANTVSALGDQLNTLRPTRRSPGACRSRLLVPSSNIEEGDTGDGSNTAPMDANAVPLRGQLPSLRDAWRTGLPEAETATAHPQQ